MRRHYSSIFLCALVLAGCSLCAMALVGCHTADPEEETPPAAVVFTYPVDGQRDVPPGARLLVSFSQPVADQAASQTAVVGPDGPVAVEVGVTGQGKTLAITSSRLEPGTSYQVHVGPAGGEPGGPLFAFTIASDRPRAGAPALVAVNGSDPQSPGRFRPIFDTSTLQLLFSEPLDPRSVALEPGGVELVDATTSAAVPATLVADDIHVAVDPVAPLTPGAIYEIRLGDRLVDLGGEAMAPAAIRFTALDGTGSGAIRQTFRTWQPGDPNAVIARTDAMNQMEIAHPLIGEARASVLPGVLETELGDPRALDGPIALTIPKGQRLGSTGLDVLLAGAIPSGLTTGEVWIELVTDGGGRLDRNPFHPDQVPDNTHAPLRVDLTLDLAVYAADPTGNAVLAQSVLGVQLSGIAIADDGMLTIETVGALEIDLLGIASAPTNLVVDLTSAPGAASGPDQIPPTLVVSRPGADTRDLASDEGIDLVFDEPIDLDRARAGGIVLREAGGAAVPSLLELHGSAVVLRPRAPLADHRAYRVQLSDVADRAGNAMAPGWFEVTTQAVAPTDVPPAVVAVYPGAPCALADPGPMTAGRCEGGSPEDDRYRRFALAANERITVVFDQPVRAETVVLGTTCDSGSVRVERVDDSGACLEPVAGTLLTHRRDLAFVPDRAWLPGARYQLRLVSGRSNTCEPGDLCGVNGHPANFDRLAGTTSADGGGPDLVASFLGAVATTATSMLVATSPHVDLNGSGQVEPGEPRGDDNRVALRVAGTSGLISQASFEGEDCMPATPEVEACMYMLGAIPAQLGELRDDCTLPDGSAAATCIPVAMSPQAMYSTSVTMRAGALGIALTTATGMSVMRIRERPEGPLEGYIVERDGRPTLVVALDLYLDAPDMSLPIAQHDMHSKPLAVALEGPLTFLPDGRIAISLRNAAEVPISIGIQAPFGITGGVHLVVPKGQMKLTLVSRSRRGSLP